MVYRIEYARGVLKDLKALSYEAKKNALETVERVLSVAPRTGRPLTGSYKGLWKYRVGDYRIVYRIESERLVVFVLRIRHRRNVYDGIIF